MKTPRVLVLALAVVCLSIASVRATEDIDTEALTSLMEEGHKFMGHKWRSILAMASLHSEAHKTEEFNVWFNNALDKMIFNLNASVATLAASTSQSVEQTTKAIETNEAKVQGIDELIAKAQADVDAGEAEKPKIQKVIDEVDEQIKNQTTFYQTISQEVGVKSINCDIQNEKEPLLALLQTAIDTLKPVIDKFTELITTDNYYGKPVDAILDYVALYNSFVKAGRAFIARARGCSVSFAAPFLSLVIPLDDRRFVVRQKGTLLSTDNSNNAFRNDAKVKETYEVVKQAKDSLQQCLDLIKSEIDKTIEMERKRTELLRIEAELSRLKTIRQQKQTELDTIKSKISAAKGEADSQKKSKTDLANLIQGLKKKIESLNKKLQAKEKNVQKQINLIEKLREYMNKNYEKVQQVGTATVTTRD
eukprot:TRINITY_DN492_c0_g2_i1.p1 TRINITY_DN492_c0_g2~~TRINITY_DN492_c0_g2_i1.p1  ORF type:complete len:420 (+),score=125.49 TRINITY_DN492_c0_g2_i1:66-1325(+)